MAMSFTTDQQRVIDARGCNVLVSAAAGSGKTAVLTQRIADMVCDEAHPVDIDRLLVVTFTNAAAAEMRERVAIKISEKLAQNPESEHIQRQSALIHNAQITTIDSFCLFLLRNHFNEIGLDPAFRIADDGEVKLMQQDVLAELLEDSFRDGGDEFRACVEFFCHKGKDSALEDAILELSKFAASFPWPDRWLEERKKDYQIEEESDIYDSAWGKYLEKHVKDMASGWVDKMRLAQSVCEQPDGPYMYGELIDTELEAIEKLADCVSLKEFTERLPKVEFGRLSSKKDDSVSPVKRERVKQIRSEVKDSIGKIKNLFETPMEISVRQTKACDGPLCTLLSLTLDFNRRMAKKKHEKKLIDFGDMEHFALDILLEQTDDGVRPSAVAKEYRQHFAEILVDEYQDSNLVQEYLLSALSGEEEGKYNRFMVGDVKQSIYRFRLARPDLFLEKYHTYGDVPPNVRIDLSKNFRSRPQVLDAVNDIFKCIMRTQVGGIEYDDKAALYPGAVYPDAEGNEAELILIENPGEEEDLSTKQTEAKAVAARIKNLLGSYLVTDKKTGELRPVRYSDMVILLRSNSGWDEEFKGIFEEEGIPAFVAARKDILAQQKYRSFCRCFA